MGDGQTRLTQDTMRGRAEESSWKLWVLMEADRRAVSSVLFIAIFLIMVGVGLLDPSPLQQTILASDPVETLFQGLLTGIITGVTLVVALNQIVLSQELGAAGDQRERMEETLRFRSDVADHLDIPVSPREPAAFLQALIDEIKSAADRIADTVDDSIDDIAVQQYADGVARNAEIVSDSLDDARFGTFSLISAALNFNYSRKLSEAQRMQAEYRDTLDDDTTAALQELEALLSLFGPAREHIKTLYFRWELINLSRAMLYTALPALMVSAVMIVYHDASAITGTLLGVSGDIVVIGAATSIALLPFLLLLSYILRIATVTKRTLSIGPFVLRDTGK